jgi:hypothetical protein
VPKGTFFVSSRTSITSTFGAQIDDPANLLPFMSPKSGRAALNQPKWVTFFCFFIDFVGIRRLCFE